MATLYDIESEIESMLSIPDDQLSDEDKARLDEYLSELANQEADKVDSAVYKLKEWKAKAEFFKAEAASFTAKQKALEYRMDRLKGLYKDIMEQNNLKAISGEKYKISLQNSAPALAVYNPALIPAKYWVQAEPTLSKSAALADVKAGIEVPGCALMVSQHIRYR